MQKIILKSEKTNEEIELSLGILMSTSNMPAEQQAQFLLEQTRTNLQALTSHFQKNVGDKLTYVKTVYLD